MALQASLLLALQPEGSARRVRELAEDIGVGATYLAKILHNLTRVGLLRGERGPGGGVRLAHPAREISPWDILAAVEPAGEFDQCVLGLERCNGDSPCPLHEAWLPIRTQILAMLQDKSLYQIAQETRSKGILFSQLFPSGPAGDSAEGAGGNA